MPDEDVRAMRITGKAKFLIFVLRKWKVEKSLQSMKGVVPSGEFFEQQKQEVMAFKASEAANTNAEMPCVDTGSFLGVKEEQSMWDSFEELEEQEAHKRAFGGSVGAPAINLDSGGNVIPPWEPPVTREKSIGSMLADDEVAELRDADEALVEVHSSIRSSLHSNCQARSNSLACVHSTARLLCCLIFQTQSHTLEAAHSSSRNSNSFVCHPRSYTLEALHSITHILNSLICHPRSSTLAVMHSTTSLSYNLYPDSPI
jgi:hypothetical protein